MADKKITDLPVASSVAVTALVEIVDVSGPTSRSATMAQVRDRAGVCTLEQFGAVGDGVTHDGAALTAAIAAITANTYGALSIGAKNYHFTSGTYTLPAGDYFGQGRGQSILSFTHNAVLLQVSSNSTTLREFQILGNRSTNAAQVGVQCGVSGGAVCPDKNVVLDIAVFDCPVGIRCVNGNGSSHRGVVMRNPEIRIPSNTVTNVGIDVLEQAEYVHIISPVIYGDTLATYYGYGIQIAAGACYIEHPRITEVNRAFNLLTGTNAGHATCVGGELNHNAAPFYGTGDFNGFRFVGTNMYSGQFYFHLGTEIHLEHCSLNPDAGTSQQIYIDGAGTGNRITECEFSGNPTVDINANGQIWFSKPTTRDNLGTVPSVIAAYIQAPFTFASDANETLSLQKTTAETILVANGVISVSRKITINQAVAKAISRRMRFVNNNTYAVTVGWLTGSAVTVGAGATSDVGSDGTNAILLTSSASSAAGAVNHVQTSDGAGAFVDSTLLAASGYISIPVSTAAAASGALRLSYAAGARPIVVSRDSVNTGDWIFATSTGSATSWGLPTGTTNVLGYNVGVYASNAAGVLMSAVAGGGVLVTDALVTSAHPILGMSSASSPWGVHGQTQVDVGGLATKTLSAAEYSMGLIRFVGAPSGALCTVTLPLPASDAHAYAKTVNCDAIGSTDTVRFTVGSGTTVDVTGGAGAVGARQYRLWFTPAGVS